MRDLPLPLFVRPLVLALGSLLIVGGCNSSSTTPKKSDESPSAVSEVEFPEGDPSVSAEDGGPGFTGEGWTTSDPGYLGDPDAVKGGTITFDIPSWPTNLRMYGKAANSYLNYILGARQRLMYQSLLDSNPNTMEPIPQLASHWQIDDDKMTFRFRIDPKAHWSDGKPVTTDDVLATYDLLLDETLLDPANRQMMLEFEKPKALSKYIVEVKAKKVGWIHFLVFANTILLPAHEIGDLTGKEYMDQYDFKFTAINGPYKIEPSDIENNQHLILTRRDDFWAKDYPRYTGLFNFDKIRFLVVRDSRLAFEKIGKGEIDYQLANTAKWFVEDAEKFPAVQKNWLIKRKFFTQAPNGIQGFAFNMRRSPVNDLNVRKAIGYLFDRETLIEKFALNEYVPIDSFYPGAPYANPDNEKIRYNPEKAVQLLEEAGWTERGPDGVLVKDGKRLSLDIIFNTPGLEKYYTSLKESCRKVGVEIKLQLVDPPTLFKSLLERKFTVASMAWGANPYPNPEMEWHSELADKEGSNNATGFKSKKVDELIAQYNKEFDLEKRHELLKQIDGLIFEQHPYSLAWYLDNQRVMYWNKFGMPEYGLHRYLEWDDAFATWWVDPEKEKALKEARKANKPLPEVPLENRYWQKVADQQPKAN